MKSLNKTSLYLALVVLPASAYADLASLTDQDLSKVTGQSGITIEVRDASVRIGELNYRDEGNIYIEDTGLVGAGAIQALRGQTVTDGALFDNVVISIDIAGDAADSAGLQSQWGLAKINDPALVLSTASTGDHGETAVAINDGDLVIGIGAIDQADMVDFGVYAGRVSLGASNLGAGDGATNIGTVLMSDVLAEGFAGPIDLVIDGQENNININSYVDIEGEATLDFVAASFEFKFHNRRGSDVLIYDNLSTGESVSYFHAQADIGAAADPDKGLQFHLTDASGDIDLNNIVMGSAPAIGDVYLTDLTLRADMNIYGH